MRTPAHGLALLVITAACSDDPATHSTTSAGGALGTPPPTSGEAGAPSPSGGSSMATGGSVTASSSGGMASGAPSGGSPPAATGGSAAGPSSGGAEPDSPASGGSAPAGTGGSAAGQSGAGSGGESGSQPLSFQADIWPVISTVRDPVFVYYDGSTYESCVTIGVCHGGENPGAGLRMPDPETAYEMLFDVPSRSGLCNGTTRVVAGDPDQSCFILFYEGRLRDELDWVGTPEIDLMRRWIAEGALP